MSIKGLDDSDVSSPLELDETPTIKDGRWSLDFRGASIPAASKDPEAIKAALGARLRRIEKERDRDPWLDTVGEVRSISESVRALTVNVEVPADATHKLVGGLFEGSYVKDPQISEDRQGFWVTFVEGVRKDRRVLTSFADLVKVDGFPDLDLEKMLAPGKTGSYIGPRPRRK